MSSREKGDINPRQATVERMVGEYFDYDDKKKVKDFQGEKFMNGLLRKALPGMASSDFQLDYDNLEEVFTFASDVLQELREETEENIRGLLGETQEAEGEFKMNLGTYQENLGGLMGDFADLDTRISRVSHTAVRIGDRMETVDAQQQRILEGEKLMKYYLDFNNDASNSTFQNISNKADDDLFTAADWMARLKKISQDVRIAKGPANDAIGRTSKEIENELINRFDAAGAKEVPDHRTMKKFATVLEKYGKDTVTHYVDRQADTISDMLPSLTSGLREMGQFKENLRTFFEQLEALADKQIQLCINVFSRHKQVLDALLETIFLEGVRGFMDRILRHSDARFIERDRLRIIEHVFKETKSLVSRIDELVKNLCIQYKDVIGDQEEFIMEESKLLDAVFAITRKNYLQQEKTYFDVELQQISQELASFFPQVKKESTRGYTGKKKHVISQNDMEGILDGWVTCMPQMIKISSDVMIRCSTIITDPKKLTQALKQLSAILITKFKGNADRILEETRGLIPVQDVGKKEEPPLGILSVVGSITSMVDLLESHVQSEIIPRIPSINEQTLCAQDQRRILGELEKQFLYILQTCKAEFNKNVTRILKGQQKNAYRDEESLSETNVCENLCRFLVSVGVAIAEGLTGKNYDKFMKIFGIETYKKLLEHYSKLKTLGGVSQMGGMILIKETQRYHQTVMQWRSESVSDSFEALMSVPNLFIVEPFSLQNFIEEDEHLAKVPTLTIRKLLEARLDMGKEQIDSFMNQLKNG